MYEDANRAIWTAYRRSRSRRASQGHFPALIQAIDQLLFELEELNLTGVDRVPGRLRERSSRVLAFVPVEDPEEIRIRHRVVPMMDTLFRAQELVFRAKDPDRPSEHDDEERSA
ncbi:MAG: hypothetical protein E6I85_13705 [Chloroflexi bacterium]|nr:MAG: hypothetical protein E6I85_13705 [Chloroflexota bacterium]